MIKSIRFFFFFQAEDGIRDKLVTGVQTCALPISNSGGWSRAWPVRRWTPGSAAGLRSIRDPAATTCDLARLARRSRRSALDSLLPRLGRVAPRRALHRPRGGLGARRIRRGGRTPARGDWRWSEERFAGFGPPDQAGSRPVRGGT